MAITKQLDRPGVLETQEIQTFETDAAIDMGKPVKLNTDNEVVVSGNYSNGDLSIGVIMYDDVYVAQNGTTVIAAGDIARVIMNGPTFRILSGGTVTQGAFVKLDSSGRVVNEATATTKTINTWGIALSGTTSANVELKVMRL